MLHPSRAVVALNLFLDKDGRGRRPPSAPFAGKLRLPPARLSAAAAAAAFGHAVFKTSFHVFAA